jgi:hypothetical protein
MVIFYILVFNIFTWVSGQMNLQHTDCARGSDSAQEFIKLVETPGFPKPVKEPFKCKFSISSNFGKYIKIQVLALDLPCTGNNGIWFIEKAVNSRKYCGKQKIPQFVATDSTLDVYFLVDVPGPRGASYKLSYKTVETGAGAKIKANKGPARLPTLSTMGEPVPLDYPAYGNAMYGGGGGRRGGGGGRVGGRTTKPGYDPDNLSSFNNHPVQSYNPSSYNEPEKDEQSGAKLIRELTAPILILIILISVLIYIMHRHKEKLKNEMDKIEESKPSTSTLNPNDTMRKSPPTENENVENALNLNLERRDSNLFDPSTTAEHPSITDENTTTDEDTAQTRATPDGNKRGQSIESDNHNCDDRSQKINLHNHRYSKQTIKQKL